MAGIEDWYNNNPNVKIITNLDDIGEPYSCNQWGEQYEGFEVIPLITDDGDEDVLWSWFNISALFPSIVYIDHTMTVYTKTSTLSSAVSIFTIDDMLDECGDLCSSLYSGNNELPKEIEIDQNYPNPFNPSTQINYYLPNSSLVKINVYDINGNLIDQILDEYKNSGHHSITWMPKSLSSGIYFVEINENKISKKIKVSYAK